MFSHVYLIKTILGFTVHRTQCILKWWKKCEVWTEFQWLLPNSPDKSADQYTHAEIWVYFISVQGASDLFWYLWYLSGDSTSWTGPGQSSLSAKRSLVSDICSSCPSRKREHCGWRSARGSLGNPIARRWCWPKARAMTQATTVASTRTLKLLLMEPQLPVYMSLFEVTRHSVCLKIL